MAKQIINVGEEANDGGGDPIRTAWTKANANFTELYDKFTDFVLTDAGIADGVAGQVLTTDGSGGFTFEDASAGGSSFANTDVDSHLNANTAVANNSVLGWVNNDYKWVAQTSGIALTDISVGAEATASGDGGISYDNTSGVFTYTPPVIPTVPTDLTDLGIVDGANGQVLTTDGAGNFTFENASGAVGLTARAAKSGTTSSIADGATANLDITGFKGYALLAIQTDKAAWVRVYANGATRTADASRAETSDPAPDAGVIAEVITTGAQTVLVSPGTIGYNFESTPTTTIPCAVTNKSGSTGTVQVTLTVIQLEA